MAKAIARFQHSFCLSLRSCWMFQLQNNGVNIRSRKQRRCVWQEEYNPRTLSVLYYSCYIIFIVNKIRLKFAFFYVRYHCKLVHCDKRICIIWSIFPHIFFPLLSRNIYFPWSIIDLICSIFESRYQLFANIYIHTFVWVLIDWLL